MSFSVVQVAPEVAAHHMQDRLFSTRRVPARLCRRQDETYLSPVCPEKVWGRSASATAGLLGTLRCVGPGGRGGGRVCAIEASHHEVDDEVGCERGAGEGARALTATWWWHL